MKNLLLSCVFLCGSVLSFAQVDPNELPGRDGGTYTSFDEYDYTWSVVNCEEGASINVDMNPDEELSDQVGVFTTSACTEEGFQCDMDFVPMDFSIRHTFHVQVWAPAMDKKVVFKIFEKDNPDNNHVVEAMTTKAGEWDTLSFDFSAAENGVYNKWSIHPDFGSETVGEIWYFNLITVARHHVTYDDGVLFDFDEYPNYMYMWDCSGGAAEFLVVDNPIKDENNMSETVGMMVTSVCTYEGAATHETFVPFDFSQGAVFTIKVLAPRADATFRFKIENHLDHNNQPLTVDVQTTVGGEWEILAFDFDGAQSDFYDRIAVFPDRSSEIEFDEWFFDDVRFTGQLTGVEDRVIKVADYKLDAMNYPNPFNPTTTIQYRMAKPSNVTLTIYDLNGRLVETLVDQHMAEGEHSASFDGSEYAGGVYLYKVQTDYSSLVNKMVLVK